MIENLGKRIIENGGIIKPLIIPPSLAGGTGQMNPSILINDGKIIGNIRNVQYVLVHSENEQYFPSHWGPLTYLHPENDRTLRTTNFYFELDSEMDIRVFHKVDTSELDVTPVWEFIGLEDARLVKWEDKLFMIGVRRDTKPNGEGRMELSEIEVTPKGVKEINRIRIQSPDPKSYCEKNWMPILDMPYHMVKWTNPTEIVKLNTTEKVAETFHLSSFIPAQYDMRGGSQVIPFKDGRLALVHETVLFNNELGQKDGIYYHRFVMWNKDWQIIKISDRFNFMDARVEFSCGLAEFEGSFLITFGFQDNAAYIAKVPVKFVEDMLYDAGTIN